MNNDTAQPTGGQYLDLSFAIAGETCRYLEEGSPTKEEIQKLIGDKERVKAIARKNAHELLQLISESTLAAKVALEKYFLEVFGLKLNLSKMAFPVREGFDVFMVNPPQLSEDAIMEAFKKKWGINTYAWMTPIASSIDRKSEQKRPKGLYAFAHRGGDEPDKEHMGKSYDDSMAANLTFTIAKEYLLVTGFHKFTKGNFMDVKGWTRNATLWSDGYLVRGYWRPGTSRLGLYYGSRGDRSSDGGPRELVYA